MTIGNLILDGHEQTLFSENKTKAPLSEVKMLLFGIKELIEESLCMYAKLFKDFFHYMQKQQDMI